MQQLNSVQKFSTASWKVNVDKLVISSLCLYAGQNICSETNPSAGRGNRPGELSCVQPAFSFSCSLFVHSPEKPPLILLQSNIIQSGEQNTSYLFKLWDKKKWVFSIFPEELRWNYCLPATTINTRSHVTFTAFGFSFVSYMRLLFQLQGQYCFSLTTKHQIICIYMELSFRSVPP